MLLERVAWNLYFQQTAVFDLFLIVLFPPGSVLVCRFGRSIRTRTLNLLQTELESAEAAKIERVQRAGLMSAKC